MVQKKKEEKAETTETPVEERSPEKTDASEPGAAAAADGTEGEAQETTSSADAEVAELKDKLLRALADAENTRRRANRELEETRRYAAAALAKDLLNVCDNLRRALESVPGDPEEQDEAVKTLITGIELVEKELLAAFEKHGVRKIEPLGEKFDHNFHQAMYEVENTGKPAGTVVELLQPGYLIHDRLLRPAMVAVAKGEPEGPPDDVERVDTTA